MLVMLALFQEVAVIFDFNKKAVKDWVFDIPLYKKRAWPL
jgi:hypothetical protein